MLQHLIFFGMGLAYAEQLGIGKPVCSICNEKKDEEQMQDECTCKLCALKGN